MKRTRGPGKRPTLIAQRRLRAEARYGCDQRQHRELVAIGAARKFVMHKATARRRGVAFDLTLWQWWEIWQASGRWNDRGRGHGYVMCRTDDVGPYAVGNVYIATGGENVSHGFAYRKKREHLSDLTRGAN